MGAKREGRCEHRQSRTVRKDKEENNKRTDAFVDSRLHARGRTASTSASICRLGLHTRFGCLGRLEGPV
jgi:hypothetical protein